MIKSFKNKLTERVFNKVRVKGMADDLQRAAYRRLVYLDVARVLNDLAVPPGNRLEALGGDRSGQYSIRINQQWRICFIWDGDSAYEVEIVDYH